MNTILRQIAPRLIAPLLKFLFATLRLRIVGNGDPLPSSGIIFAFWHGHMITGWLLARKLFPDRKTAAVVSLSTDGQILSATLARLGFDLIRGSSSRGGEVVRSGMIDLLHRNGVVALTPDGPRGPACTFKYGTIRLASENGIPIIFARIAHAKKKQLKSWDHFEIPSPFSRVTITLDRIDLPRFSSEEELRHHAANLSSRFSHD